MCLYIHRRTQDFTVEGVHVVEGRARVSEGRKSPSGSRGKAPVGGAPETKANCEINVRF